VEVRDGAYDIFREGNSRYVRYPLRSSWQRFGNYGQEAIEKVTKQVKVPRGYHLDWAGEYESEKRAQARLFSWFPSLSS